MHGARGRKLVAMMLLALLAAGLFLLVRFLSVKGMIWAGAFGGIAAFFLALGLALSPYFKGRLRGPSPVSTKGVNQAADDLAKALALEIAEEERQRQVNDPYPLPVSWDVTPIAQLAMRGIMDELSHDRTPSPRATMGTLAGQYGEILSVFQRLPSRRLVILGSAGAGKSMLATKLARELLAARRDAMPVPIIVSASTWEPSLDLSSWIADQLARTHPGLAVQVEVATGRVARVAEVLANDGLLPILDGLDELPEASRVEAIKAINAWGSDMPIVATSRPIEYLAAVLVGDRVVSGSVVVEILPLQVPQVKAYLSQATGVTSMVRWRNVFDMLDNDPNGPLAIALTTPLMVWLARTIYERSDRDPDELTQDKLLTNRETVEQYLLDAFVPSVYARRDTLWHRWSPKQAQRWLAFLAAYLRRTNSQDIASWQLSNAARVWRPVGFAVRGMLMFAAVWELASWVIRRHRELQLAQPLPAKLSELLLNGPLGRRIFPTVNHVLSGSFPVVGYVTRPIFYVATWPPWHSLLVLEIWVALIALIAGTFSAIDSNNSSYGDRVMPRTVRIRPSAAVLNAGSAAWAGAFKMTGIIFVVSACYVLVKPHTSIDITWHGLLVFLQAHSIGLLLALGALWSLTSVPDSFFASIDISQAISPAKVLQIDRRATMLVQLSKRVLRTGVVWLCFGDEIAIAYGVYAALILLCRLALGGMGSASDRFADARIWLACSRQMPLRAMTFLSDAHIRGVLRQAGAMYQFRHIRLQERLSRQYTSLSVRLAFPFVHKIDQYKAQSGNTWWPVFTGQHFESVWALRFQEAATLLSEEVELGAPTEEIRPEGKCLAQAFDGGDDGWTLCAAPGRPPVLVPGRVWETLWEVRRKVRYPKDLGVPVMDSDIPIQHRIISADARSLKMDGGNRGPGRLVRDDVHNIWNWEYK